MNVALAIFVGYLALCAVAAIGLGAALALTRATKENRP